MWIDTFFLIEIWDLRFPLTSQPPFLPLRGKAIVLTLWKPRGRNPEKCSLPSGADAAGQGRGCPPLKYPLSSSPIYFGPFSFTLTHQLINLLPSHYGEGLGVRLSLPLIINFIHYIHDIYIKSFCNLICFIYFCIKIERTELQRKVPAASFLVV